MERHSQDEEAAGYPGVTGVKTHEFRWISQFNKD